MPHYPDDIEYSDKYTDDAYEYRHVILPKDSYKKMPRARLLTESVSINSCRNGEPLEFSNPEVGYTMSYIVQNHISFCLGEPKALTHRPVYHQLDLSHHLTHSLIDLNKYALSP